MEIYQVQDVILIQMMYSLAIDSCMLYALTYEDISSDGKMLYWDYKQRDQQ